MATDSNAILRSLFPANAQKYVFGTDEGSLRNQSDLRSGFISSYSASRPQDCAQASGQQVAQIRQATASGLGLLAPGGFTAKISSVISNALNTIPVVGPFLSQVWNTINPFAAHAQAVAKEQSTLCALIPQVNDTLAATDAAVRSGQIDVADADAQLEAMVQAFDSATSGITKDSGSTCNAACVMRAEVRAEATLHEQGYRTSPLYFLKKYWWVGALGFVAYLLLRK